MSDIPAAPPFQQPPREPDPPGQMPDMPPIPVELPSEAPMQSPPPLRACSPDVRHFHLLAHDQPAEQG